MITQQQEWLTDSVIEEMQPLLAQHYQELTLHKEVVKLHPVWDRYMTLQSVGAFKLLTVRDEGKLIGYSAFFITQHMHYAELDVAINDVFYIDPAYRAGPTAFRMIRFAEAMLKDEVQKLTYHYKFGNKLALILDRMGYSREEGVSGKIL